MDFFLLFFQSREREKEGDLDGIYANSEDVTKENLNQGLSLPAEKCLVVWASLCRTMNVHRLTLEVCFHIHLLKEESFSLSFRHVPTSLWHHIVWKPIRVQYVIYTSVMLKCEISNLGNLDWGLFSEERDILHHGVTFFNIFTFKYYVFFNEAEGIDAI